MAQTDTTANCRAVLPSEDHHFDVHNARVSGGDYSTRRWPSSEALIRWTFFLLGCAILLPLSALVHGTPFFLSRLASSSFYTAFSSSLLSVYAVTKLFCLSYCTITLKQSSPSRRIINSITIMIFFIASLCASTFIRSTPLSFFSFALLNAASLAVLTSYLTAAVYAQAALLGPLYLRSMLSGQGAFAVGVSAVQVVSAIISLWGLSLQSIHSTTVHGKDYDVDAMAARIFFGVCTLLLGTTLAAYVWLTRQEFYQFAVGNAKQQSNIEDTDELTGLVSGNRKRILTEDNARTYHVLKYNWDFMLSIACVAAVSIALYPSITVRVRPVNSDIPLLLFAAVHFLATTTGDLIGRQTSTIQTGSNIWSAKRILAMSLIRTLFIPLILLCNIYRPGTTAVHPIINSDILFMVILVALGFTNGFFLCLAILTVSSPERNPRLEGREDVDIAATLGSTFTIVGMVFGAFISFGVGAVI